MVPFIQEVLGAYISRPFLDTDELKMALRAWKVPGAFEKQAVPRPRLLKEVIDELHSIRSNCSTGPDNIPSTMIKMVADYLGPPLADVINTCNKNIGLEARGQLRDS